ncbi:amidase signature enzyme [Annulohypoxylon maeteangense]|uniref:amidase signature enzyme n=1 Tax=Annulohypoxylon maeteangense TaxID=1927788 RepID=UPI002007D321|nr:amidase signature enzyme [Annulohypoxylon maeteangense]KAI0880184.1 amidase signature enzyme [Annulohypoxylon maeteangense]
MASQQVIRHASIETLREIAKANGFLIRPQDEPEYLDFVHAAEESVDFVNRMPDYIDSQLTPAIGASDPTSRAYTLPSASENPLNAWRYRTHIEAPNLANGIGLLAGKKVAIKDNASVAGVPTTGGTQPFHLTKDKPAPIPILDAPTVSRILEAGAVITGTSTCENYCMSAMSCTSATGPVDNPWLRGYSAGGSSSGSAVLIAINVIKKWREARGLPIEYLGEGVDFALGSDQGGSIRIPAAYCGIHGLKPTHGLVPFTGINSLFPILDHAGPMASSVRDTALLLTALAGYDGFDPRMTPETPLRSAVPQYHAILDEQIAARTAAGTWTAQAAARNIRVGVLKEAFEVAGIDPEVVSVVRKASSRFAVLGASVTDVSIPLHLVAPHIFTASTRTHMGDILLARQGSSTASSLPFPFPASAPATPDQIWYETMTASNPLTVGLILSSELLGDRSKYPESVREKAVRHVQELRAAYDRALQQFDVLIMPATPTVGPRHARADMGVAEKAGFLLSNTVNTMPFNITGHPGLVIPVGWGQVGGGDGNGKKLPVSMQIVGKRWDEQTVFLAAAAWEVGGLGLDE